MNPNTQAIGENIPQPVQQAVAPDVHSGSGQGALFAKAVNANKNKELFDGILKKIADKSGSEYSSRVKNIETAAAKIAQKRLQGRTDYGIDKIGDMLGGRIVVPSDKKINIAKQAVKEVAKESGVKVTKAEDASHGTYKGFHYDVTLPTGQKAEIQIHTPQSELEAVANHSLRSQFGENPTSGAVKQLRKLQAEKAKDMPSDKAKMITKAMKEASQTQGGQLLPTQTAQMLS